MSELVLFLGERPDPTTLRWRVTDGGSTLRTGDGVPPDDARAERVVGVLDARAVHVRSVTVPARQRSQMVRALPYVVEEFLAEDIESQHLALARGARPGAPVRVAALDRRLLTAWLDLLAEHGLRLNSLVPESALLPAPEAHTLELLGTDDGWLFATSDAAGRFPDDWWSIVIDDLLDGVRAVDVLLAADADVDIDAVRTSQIETGGGEEPVGLSVERLPVRTADWLVARLADGAADIELLQGDYAPADDAPALPGALRLLGSLAAGWLVLFVAVQAGSAWLLDSSAERLRADTHALYRELFPDEQRIVNPVAQMRAHLADSGVAMDGGTFMELFARAAKGIAGADVDLRNVSYNSSRDDASIEILTREFATLESLQERLGNSGLDVEITSAEQEEGIIRARLRVSVATS